MIMLMWFVYDGDTGDLACIVPDESATATFILDDLSKMGYVFRKIDTTEYEPGKGE